MTKKEEKTNSKEDAGEAITFECSADFVFSTSETILENGDSESVEVYHINALVGDRFMNGGFFSAEEAARVYTEWEGTLHDINHEGTGAGKADITKFVGYHTNVTYNSETKTVSMDIVPAKDTPYCKSWEAYLKLCKNAGRIPNVSVTYAAMRRFVKAGSLADRINLADYGLTANDTVPVLSNVIPICVSTVLQGRCNDKEGCGFSCTCSGEEDTEEGEDSDSCDCELEAKRQELIEWLKKNDAKKE